MPHQKVKSQQQLELADVSSTRGFIPAMHSKATIQMRTPAVEANGRESSKDKPWHVDKVLLITDPVLQHMVGSLSTSRFKSVLRF